MASILLEKSKAKNQWTDKVIKYLTLWKLRRMIIYNNGLGVFSDTKNKYKLFEKILRKAKRRVNSWGGKLYFVYLPSWQSFKAERSEGLRYDKLHKEIIGIAEKLELPVIDVRREFQDIADKDKLFVFPASHYSAEGYRIAGNVVSDFLALKSIFP